MCYEFTMIQGCTIDKLLFLMKDDNQVAIFLQMFFSSVCILSFLLEKSDGLHWLLFLEFDERLCS